MDDGQIQELILTFLDTRGGYVVGASERELFLMVKQAVAESNAGLLDAEAAMRAAERRALFAASDERARIVPMFGVLMARLMEDELMRDIETGLKVACLQAVARETLAELERRLIE